MNTTEQKLFLLKAAEKLELLCGPQKWDIEYKQSLGAEKFELSTAVQLIAGISLTDLNEFNKEINRQGAYVNCIFCSTLPGSNTCKLEISIYFK